VVRYGATLSPGAALRAVRTRLHDPSLAVLVALWGLQPSRLDERRLDCLERGLAPGAAPL